MERTRNLLTNDREEESMKEEPLSTDEEENERRESDRGEKQDY